jgi:glyoxylase-like metal-dependent hydrolase (beta-lactamase superfamily II)
MPKTSDRREFLKSTLSTGAGIALSHLAIRPALSRDRAAPIVPRRLNDHLVALSGAGANSVALQGPEGVFLIDGGLVERSGDLLKAVLAQTHSKAVHTLVNTHWHPEQTGSNERLAKAGAQIIAHENTRLWLEYAQQEPGRPGTWGPLPPKARPNHTIYATEKLTFAGEQIELGYLLQAHTDGDIYAFLRESNVLVAGGVVSNEGWPVVDYKTGGWIGGLVEGLKTLVGLVDDHTVIVPANGPPLTKAELVAQQQMYATIFDRLQKLLRKGLGPDEVLAQAPTREFDAQWGDSKQFVELAFKSLWGHMAADA